MDSDSKGRWFESSRVRAKKQTISQWNRLFFVLICNFSDQRLRIMRILRVFGVVVMWYYLCHSPSSVKM